MTACDNLLFIRRFVKKAVLPFAREGKRALDFGSGPVPVLAILLEREYDYQVDIYDLFFSPKKVYEGKKYDLITSTEVLEHLSDPLGAFKLLASLLAPDGIFALMTLLHQNEDDHFLSWHYIREQSHITFYSLETLSYLAAQAGLEMLYSDKIRYACFGLKACT